MAYTLGTKSPSCNYSVKIGLVTSGETGFTGAYGRYSVDGWVIKHYYYNSDGTPRLNEYYHTQVVGTTTEQTTSFSQVQNMILGGQVFSLDFSMPITEQELRTIMGNAVADYVLAKIKPAPPVNPEPPVESKVEHTFKIRFWSQLPKSLEMPILETLVKYESKFGWTFWTCNITDDTLTITATKNGSVTISLVVATIIAIAVMITGLIVVRSWSVVAVEREITKQELSEERQGIETTKQQIMASDLPSDVKAKLITDLQTYQNNLTPPTPNGDSTLGEMKDIMLIAIVGALAIGLLKSN